MDEQQQDMIHRVLRMVRLSGGSEADGRYLRHALGHEGLPISREIRMVSLGCADDALVDRISDVANAAA